MSNDLSFKVGDRVHWRLYSDVYPGTIVDITNGRKSIIVRYDNTRKAEDSVWHDQNWIIEDGDDDSPCTVFTYRKVGLYKLRYQSFGVLMSGWRKYVDHSF